MIHLVHSDIKLGTWNFDFSTFFFLDFLESRFFVKEKHSKFEISGEEDEIFFLKFELLKSSSKPSTYMFFYAKLNVQQYLELGNQVSPENVA